MKKSIFKILSFPLVKSRFSSNVDDALCDLPVRHKALAQEKEDAVPGDILSISDDNVKSSSKSLESSFNDKKNLTSITVSDETSKLLNLGPDNTVVDKRSLDRYTEGESSTIANTDGVVSDKNTIEHATCSTNPNGTVRHKDDESMFNTIKN